MNLPELSTPIRLYWDITPLPDIPVDLTRICGEIISLKILSLDLTASGSDVLPDSCFEIIEQCRTAHLPVTLTLSPEALTEATSLRLAANPPKELLFRINDTDDLPSALPAEIDGISFPVTEQNWRQLPELFRFAFEQGCKRLVLPMQRLYTGEQPFHLTRRELETLILELSPIPRHPAMGVTVHDPFLWRGVFPETPFPQGRCQAANTMLSISPHGIVYPCPTMPLPLGDLKKESLRDIARGSAKKELRAHLLRLPEGCSSCEEAAACKGGCRGRGERLSGSWDGIDPACR